jgi:hypothetical protein
VLIAITTNEDIAALHPAVTRPGRALARVEVGRLSPVEAEAWLSRAGARVPAGSAGAVGPHGATLAELFAIAGGHEVAPPDPAEGTGLYL